MTKRMVDDAAEAVLATAKTLLAKNLVEGTAGNVSARMDGGNICITPSSVDYRDMCLEDLVVLSPTGEVLHGDRAPSSEKLLHLACYDAFGEIGGVIHSHPVHATMFAVAHRSIPACVDEFTIFVGGDVEVAHYAPSGTAEVGHNAVEKLDKRGAALLANHGMVAIGKSPSDALHITALVERSAQIALGAMSLGGIEPLPEHATRGFAEIYDLLRNS